MSNVQATFKAASQLVTSLADQRKFNSGQVAYIGRELLERPKLEENFDRLLRVDQCACIINDKTKSDLCNSYDEYYDNLQSRIAGLVNRADGILRLEKEYGAREANLLGDERRQREEARRNTDRNTSIKLEKLSERLLSEELDMERKYLKFEENLRNK